MTEDKRKEHEEFAHKLSVDTIQEIIALMNGKMETMEAEGLPPKYGKYFAQMCGFAISGSILAFYDDEHMEEAAKDLVMEFASHMGQTVSLNKGMSKLAVPPSGKIILQ